MSGKDEEIKQHMDGERHLLTVTMSGTFKQVKKLRIFFFLNKF